MKGIYGLHIALIMACLLVPHQKVETKVDTKKEVVQAQPQVKTIVPVQEPVRQVVERERAKPETLKQYAERRTIEIFGGGWENVDYIIQHESSWVVGNINKSSGACGLGQALPCSKMKCSLSDGKCQVDWTLNYILNRYGSTKNARAFWSAHHWY